MGILVCIIIPVIILLAVLWLCRKYNFSLVPKYMKLATPEKYVLPRAKKNQYTWDGDEEDSEEEEDIEEEPQPQNYYTPDTFTQHTYESLYDR